MRTIDEMRRDTFRDLITACIKATDLTLDQCLDELNKLVYDFDKVANVKKLLKNANDKH
jgi:hypothetical protein